LRWFGEVPAKSAIALTRLNEISGQFAFRGLSYWARRVLATDSRERRIASQSSKAATSFRHFLASSVICKEVIAGRHEFYSALNGVTFYPALARRATPSRLKVIGNWAEALERYAKEHGEYYSSLAQNTLEYLSRFDCDDAIDVWVASAINDAHGSAPDFFENFVAADKASSLNPPQNRRQTGAANCSCSVTVQSLQGVLGPYGQCAPSLRRVRSSPGISTLTRQKTFPGSCVRYF